MLLLLLTVNIFLSQFAFCVENPGEELSKVGIDSKQGASVNLDLQFTSSDGKTGTLRQLIDPSKPILLTPVYYHCPRLCGLLLAGFSKLLREMDLKMMDDYQVLTISFDDKEGPEMAKEKSEKYYQEADIPNDKRSAWHFLVGNKENVTALMNQIGFRYFKEDEEFAHTAAVIILTPQGEISQYFTGIEFSPWDVRLALIEASQGKVGSLVDHILLFCFRYDHKQGKYTWAVSNLLRVGGGLSLITLAGLIFWATRRRI